MGRMVIFPIARFFWALQLRIAVGLLFFLFSLTFVVILLIVRLVPVPTLFSKEVFRETQKEEERQERMQQPRFRISLCGRVHFPGCGGGRVPFLANPFSDSKAWAESEARVSQERARLLPVEMAVIPFGQSRPRG